MAKRQFPAWTDFSLTEQIGQMIVVRASGYCFDQQIRYPIWEAPNQQLSRWLEQLNLGGVILLGGSALELAQRTKQLQAWAKTPLLIAADLEEGVGQRFAGGTWFPPPLALGAIASQDLDIAQEYARHMGAITASEALSLGINWLLAPVVDVNNNPANPVINVRAFGEIPQIVSALAGAFITGARQFPVLTTAKHFPGHGDTQVDSHLELPVLNHSLERLKEIELPPFQEAIAQGVDSVMTGHLLIPAWDSLYPATLSQEILTHQLRRGLGFDGLIVTDALNMGAITNYAPLAEIAVQAIAAGADLLLMPQDPEIAISAIASAVKSGRLTPQRIAQSLTRIWRAKTKITVQSIPHPLTTLSRSKARETVGRILTQSNQGEGHLSPEVSLCNLIVVDDLLHHDFIDFSSPGVTIPQAKGYGVKFLDQRTLPLALTEPQSYLLQIFVRGNPWRTTAGLRAEVQAIYQQLLEKDQIKGLVIYGSPYVLAWFRSQLCSQVPWVFSYGQMPQAQAIALNRLLT
ncbi:glycoside hydrolase family 3 N-terminal domain-containing protein [Gloeocapsa sp. PCC 73106]|uniref:glycoside hydrolase family 3 N-terminal domain-containing protein n=1 Tax=Gloeocapsa sp. PCC 73106 TaxID=102232 RepID=UPI0002ACD806|nr:glycoside hydrolase family 3 N-terminal domain-containing protein [Gloeocapsa sp. PCC 73106]ELR96998.1 beta-glucosidase-like glycosyl hydrolase [Gloeocapsa sp. PCC 73106]